MSLWDNEESLRQQQTQRVIIIAAAVAATLIIFWVFRNAVAIASHPGRGGGFAASGRTRQLINGMDTDSAPLPPQLTSANPGAPVGSGTRYTSPASRAPAYIAPPPPPLVGGAYAPRPYIAPTLPDLSPEERADAKAATVPLRQTLTAVHDFDRRSFWNHDSQNDARSHRTEEADNAADALGAMVALYGHPDRFPAPMRSTAATAATGIRSYLRLTLDAAATDDPAERQRMRPSALKRLTEADAAVDRLEGVNPNNGFASGRASN